MTLTVVDGDFPREVLANQNLKFGDFQMAASRNKPELYDTKLHGPAGKRDGILIGSHLGDLPAGYGQSLLDRQAANRQLANSTASAPSPARRWLMLLGSVGGLLILVRWNSIRQAKHS